MDNPDFPPHSWQSPAFHRYAEQARQDAAYELIRAAGLHWTPEDREFLKAFHINP